MKKKNLKYQKKKKNKIRKPTKKCNLKIEKKRKKKLK